MKSFVTVALGASLALWAVTGAASTSGFVQVAGEGVGLQSGVGLIIDDFIEADSSFGLGAIKAADRNPEL